GACARELHLDLGVRADGRVGLDEEPALRDLDHDPAVVAVADEELASDPALDSMVPTSEAHGLASGRPTRSAPGHRSGSWGALLHGDSRAGDQAARRRPTTPRPSRGPAT